MFPPCILDKKIQRKEPNNTMFLKLVLNVMIMDIKIHIILDVIEILKSMKPNNYTH